MNTYTAADKYTGVTFATGEALNVACAVGACERLAAIFVITRDGEVIDEVVIGLGGAKHTERGAGLSADTTRDVAEWNAAFALATSQP